MPSIRHVDLKECIQAKYHEDCQSQKESKISFPIDYLLRHTMRPHFAQFGFARWADIRIQRYISIASMAFLGHITGTIFVCRVVLSHVASLLGLPMAVWNTGNNSIFYI